MPPAHVMWTELLQTWEQLCTDLEENESFPLDHRETWSWENLLQNYEHEGKGVRQGGGGICVKLKDLKGCDSPRQLFLSQKTYCLCCEIIFIFHLFWYVHNMIIARFFCFHTRIIAALWSLKSFMMVFCIIIDFEES